MEERSTHAGIVITKQLQRVASVNTSEQYMKERSTHAGNVTTRQLQRVVSINTSACCVLGRAQRPGVQKTSILDIQDIRQLSLWLDNAMPKQNVKTED